MALMRNRQTAPPVSGPKADCLTLLCCIVDGKAAVRRMEWDVYFLMRGPHLYDDNHGMPRIKMTGGPDCAPVTNRDDISKPTWSGETGKYYRHYLWLRSMVFLAITSLLKYLF